MGVLKVVGFGPGSKDDMSIRAVKAIEDADVPSTIFCSGHA